MIKGIYLFYFLSQCNSIVYNQLDNSNSLIYCNKTDFIIIQNLECYSTEYNNIHNKKKNNSIEIIEDIIVDNFFTKCTHKFNYKDYQIYIIATLDYCTISSNNYKIGQIIKKYDTNNIWLYNIDNDHKKNISSSNQVILSSNIVIVIAGLVFINTLKGCYFLF